MYFASLRYTSPTFVASMVNTIASLTFVIAVVLRLKWFLTGKIPLFYLKDFIIISIILYSIVIFACRLEVLDIRHPRGMAKVLGTLISLAGAMTMTLYKGSLMRNLWQPLIRTDQGSAATHENWLKGSLLTVASCITWSIWYIMQVFIPISEL